MQIRTLTAAESPAFLALVDGAIRPPGARTSAADDFPLILGEGNRKWQFVADDGGQLVGCLACLVRRFRTSFGDLEVGGIGSVVTAAARRGEGISRLLQDHALAQLRGQQVPLAVLWTDQPEIYAGRGFQPAGLELHLLFAEARLQEALPPGWAVRAFVADDLPDVARIYGQHTLRTLRDRGDDASLYTMPGTAGLVALDDSGAVRAYVFCGKGADFPDYVTEWGGPAAVVAGLLEEARSRGLASRLLAPQGSQELVDRVVARGGAWFAQPSGCWAILDHEQLVQRAQEAGRPSPADDRRTEAAAWLGGVDPQGLPVEGPLAVAVWGFDSV